MLNVMQQAFANVGVDPHRVESFTPDNPSKKACARVLNPLPVPTLCRYCGSHVAAVSNDAVYGALHGKYPYVYLCSNADCGAQVGMHPNTNIPLGTLANRSLRYWRKRAKIVFLDIKPDGNSKAPALRTAAYEWLSGKLNMPLDECHFSWFEVDVCKKVLKICRDAKS